MVEEGHYNAKYLIFSTSYFLSHVIHILQTSLAFLAQTVAVKSPSK